MVDEDAKQALSVLIELADTSLEKLREDGKTHFEAQTKALGKIGDTLATTLEKKLNLAAQNALARQKNEVLYLEARLKRLEASAIKANESVARSVASFVSWQVWAAMLFLAFVVGFAGAYMAVIISPRPSINLDSKEVGAVILQGIKKK